VTGQSLRARKEALKKKNEDLEGEASIGTDYEYLLSKQLDIINKQSDQIDKLVSALTSTAKSVTGPPQTIIVKGVGFEGASQEYLEQEEKDNDILFIDDLVSTEDISSSGQLENEAHVGESIDDKIKKLRELKK